MRSSPRAGGGCRGSSTCVAGARSSDRSPTSRSMKPDANPEANPAVRRGLSGLTPEQLAAWLAERGVPAYRARQVGDAVWGGAIGSIDEITTLPAALRDELDEAFLFDTVADTDLREADGGLTEKALHRL